MVPQQTTKDVGANVTYSNLVQLSEEQGRVYNFFREANFDPTMMTSSRDWGIRPLQAGIRSTEAPGERTAASGRGPR